MPFDRARVAALLTVFALGLGAGACGREDETRGNQGDDPSGPATTREAETSTVGNQPVAPETTGTSETETGETETEDTGGASGDDTGTTTGEDSGGTPYP